MLKNFFWMCSGSDPDLLAQSTKAEQIKQAGIGGTVFFTAVMAFLASAYALYTVFDNLLMALFFGLVWGLLIFNLDRFIVSSIRKREKPRQEMLQALPRILLALLIAIVIAKPLELKIFEKEIDSVLLEEKNKMTLENQEQIALEFVPQIEKLETEITAHKQEIADKESSVNAYYETYIAEAEGRKGTLLVGKGPVYKEKREKHDASLAELQLLRQGNNEIITAKQTEIASLKQTMKDKIGNTQPVIDGFDGLMARITALDKLPWLPSFFIFLLFVVIETAPIISKLLSPRGEYDLKLEDAEQTVKTWVAQKADKRSNLLTADTSINDRVYTELEQDEELYAYKKVKTREMMQMQTDAFYKHQKKFLGL